VEIVIELLEGPPQFIDKYTHVPYLVVAGGAPNVWDDLETAEALHLNDHTMAVNHIAAFIMPVEHIASLHMGILSPLGMLNSPKRYVPLHCAWCGDMHHYLWRFNHNVILSGMFGMLVGLYMGYEKVVLAGMPCDGSGNFYGSPRQKKNNAISLEVHQEAWRRLYERMAPAMRDRVCSLSGFTLSLFGGYSRWLR
jgi:hypothetical protein